MTDRELMQQALEALEFFWDNGYRNIAVKQKAAADALRERLAQPEPDFYGYASRLAVAIWEQHYKDVAPQWKPLDDLIGVLTQIDNMTAGLTRLAQPEQPPTKAGELRAMKDEFWKQPEQEPVVKWDASAPLVVHPHPAFQAAPPQPEQKPVAHTLNCICGAVWDVSPNGVEEMVHAPNPPQRKPLTDEEIDKIYETKVWDARRSFARAIEAAHGIKGEA